MTSFIQELSLLGFLFALAIFLGLAGVAIYAGLKARRVAQLVATMTTSNLATAAPGYREFVGKVEAINGKTVKAPLTGVDCCWFRAKVEEFVPGRSNYKDSTDSSHWSTIRSESSWYPFMMKDSSGACVVFPMFADVTPTDRSVWYGPSREPVEKNPPRLRLDQSPGGVFRVEGTANTRFRYTEECIYAGNPLFALGQYAIIENQDEEEDYFDAEDTETWLDSKLYKALSDEAKSLTRCSLMHSASRKKEPFIVAADTQEHFLQMNRTGSKAAFGISVVPIAIAGLLLWIRFGV